MKVVINKKFGGFNLTNTAQIRLIELGYDGDYFFSRNNKELRCDSRLIQVVEELGEAANSPYSCLKIIDIPFDTVEGWYIHDYDGMETIHEDHRVWG